jgi:hypothetical protein
MTLLIHAFLRVTFDTAKLTGCAWSAADALRLRHVPSPAIRFPERAERVKGPKCLGCAPESRVRNGLAAGGRGIRTLGPPRGKLRYETAS